MRVVYWRHSRSMCMYLVYRHESKRHSNVLFISQRRVCLHCRGVSCITMLWRNYCLGSLRYETFNTIRKLDILEEATVIACSRSNQGSLNIPATCPKTGFYKCHCTILLLTLAPIYSTQQVCYNVYQRML